MMNLNANLNYELPVVVNLVAVWYWILQGTGCSIYVSSKLMAVLTLYIPNFLCQMGSLSFCHPSQEAR